MKIVLMSKNGTLSPYFLGLLKVGENIAKAKGAFWLSCGSATATDVNPNILTHKIGVIVFEDEIRRIFWG